MGPRARAFARDFGIDRFYDVGRHGICHQVIAENGLALPGPGAGVQRLAHLRRRRVRQRPRAAWVRSRSTPIMCTGQTWITVVADHPVRDRSANGPEYVSGKDVFLHIAGRIRRRCPTPTSSYGGPGLASLPMNDRRTIATQGAEISADYSTFEVDDRSAGPSSTRSPMRTVGGGSIPTPGRVLRRRPRPIDLSDTRARTSPAPGTVSPQQRAR